MSSVLNRIRDRRIPSPLEVLAIATVGVIVGIFWYEPKDRNNELYLSPESCPLLKGAGVPVSWSEREGCRYQGPARQLLSNWKIGNLVVREESVIAFRKVAP